MSAPVESTIILGGTSITFDCHAQPFIRCGDHIHRIPARIHRTISTIQHPDVLYASSIHCQLLQLEALG
jgi:hypothetical protein